MVPLNTSALADMKWLEHGNVGPSRLRKSCANNADLLPYRKDLSGFYRGYPIVWPPVSPLKQYPAEADQND